MTDRINPPGSLNSEILGALDKLAGAGMPYIDYVKKRGKEAADMAIAQDRIKQMAEEAGLERYADQSVDPVDFVPNENGLWVLWDDAALAKFAALVAEDCARVCERMGARHKDIRSAALESAAENIRARYPKPD